MEVANILAYYDTVIITAVESFVAQGLRVERVSAGNTKRGSITVVLISCLTGLESAIWQLPIFVFISKTSQSKPVKQEVNGTVILPPPLVFPGLSLILSMGWTEDMSNYLVKFSTAALAAPVWDIMGKPLNMSQMMLTMQPPLDFWYWL
jgi:hypothetical protein